MSARFIWKLFSAGMVMVLLAAGLTPAAAQEGGFTLSGTLTGADGEPLAGAVVQIEGAGPRITGAGQTVSGPDGAYSFSGLAPGEYVLTAAAEGLTLVPFYRVVQLTDESQTELDFRPQSKADTQPPADLLAPVVLGAAPIAPARQPQDTRAAPEDVFAQAGVKVEPHEFNQVGLPTFHYDRSIGTAGEPYLPDPQGDYLNNPTGLAFNSAGSLLVTDAEGSRIPIYPVPDHPAETILSYQYENGDQAFDNPRRVSLDDSQNLWLIDGERIKWIDSGYNLQMIFPADNNCTPSFGFDCRFYNAWGITYMKEMGYVAVTDRDFGRLYIFEIVNNPNYNPSKTPDPWLNPPKTLSLKYYQDGLNQPTDVAYDWWNNHLYVAETGSNRILRCPGSSSAMCVVFANSGGPGPLSFNQPQGLEIVANSTLYVADSGNQRVLTCDVKALSLPTTCTHLLGQAGMGGWTNAYFNWPLDLAISGGYLAVADAGNNRVQIFQGGKWLTRYGTTQIPYLTDENHVFRPSGVDYWNGLVAYTERDRVVVRDAYNDDVVGVIHQGCVFGRPSLGPGEPNAFVYLAVPCENQVMIYTVDGMYVDSITGYGSNNSLPFNWIVGTRVITEGIFAGALFVVDQGLSEIQIYSPAHVWQATLGSGSSSALYEFRTPTDVMITPDLQALFVADPGNNRVAVWHRSGGIYSWAPGTANEFIMDHMFTPVSIMHAEKGQVLIVQQGIQTVELWQWNVDESQWEFINYIGGRWDMTTGGLRVPSGVAYNMDDSTQIYIADRENHRVQVFASGLLGWDMIASPVMAGWNGVSTVESWAGALLAGTEPLGGGSGAEVYATFDNGQNWNGPILQACPTADPGCVDENWMTSDMAPVSATQLYVSFPRAIYRVYSSPAPSENVSIAGLPDGQLVWHLTSFKGKMYANTIFPGKGSGAQIWRTDNVGTPPVWTLVKQFNTPDPDIGFHGVSPFAEKLGVLYAATSDGQVWYSSDGAAWLQVPGLNLGGGAGSFSVFNGALYLSASSKDQLMMWRCAAAANCMTKAGWAQMALPAAMRPLRSGPLSSAVLGNQMYLAAYDPQHGAQIWRTNGSTWEKFLRDDGFGSSVQQIAWSNTALTAHNGQLIAGTVNEDFYLAGSVWMTSADWRSPSDDEWLLNLKPTFQWGITPGASSYQIQIAVDNIYSCNYAAPIVNATVSSTTFTPSSSLPADKLLCWRVRAKVGAAYKPWLETLWLYTPNPPSVPSLVWPLNGALLPGPYLALDWKNSVIPEGVVFDRYEIQIAYDSEFSKIAKFEQAQFSLLPLELERNKLYYWRVRAFNTWGEYSLWSAARSFKIAPEVPMLLAPPQGATGVTRKPTLDWSPVDGAVSYTITVSVYSNFTYPLLSKTVTADEYTFTTNLPANKKIYWRVRANGPVGSSAYASRFFTTGP